MTDLIKDRRSFLEKIASRSDNASDPFPFPGNRGRFLEKGIAPKMVLLHLATDPRQRARGNAQKSARLYGYDGADLFGADGSRAAEVERMVHTLALALATEDCKTLVTTRADEPNTPNPDRIKTLFEEDEIELLFKKWEALQAEHSVMREGKMSEALEEARRVGKGLSPATSLLPYGTATLCFITALLARELATQANSPSSDTSSEKPFSPDSTSSSSGSEETTETENETENSSHSSDDSSLNP